MPADHSLRPIRLWVNDVQAKRHKAYDTRGVIKACHDIHTTPHVVENINGVGGRCAHHRHARDKVSQRKRKRIKPCFGRGKVIGPMRQG